ncbi:MAG: hypothetical protein JXB17_08435 [Bacteroidales bacterium]|nr:hypothetical protein [Bacteroidales bacterium]
MNKIYFETLKISLFGGIISAIISGILNYYVIPVPDSIVGSIIGHSIGGFCCAFISSCIGILLLIKKFRNNTGKNEIV